MLTPPRGCPVGLGQLRPRVPRSRPWVTAKVLQGGLCLGPQNLPLPGLRSTECGPDWLSEGQQGGGGAQVTPTFSSSLYYHTRPHVGS